MKNVFIAILIVVFALSVCSCKRQAPAGSDATAVPTEISVSGDPFTPAPETPTEAPVELEPDPEFPDAKLIQLPERFTTTEILGDENHLFRYGDVIYEVNMGEDEGLIFKNKGEEQQIILRGSVPGGLHGKTENGFFVSSFYISSGTDISLPPDRMFFFNAETEQITDVGEAFESCIQCGNYLIGTLQTREDDESGLMTLYRHDIRTNERTAFLKIDKAGLYEEGFYAKYFGGDYMYFTMLWGCDSTEFGIYKVNIETGEYEKVANHGLPYAVDENGILYYGDFVYVG